MPRRDSRGRFLPSLPSTQVLGHKPKKLRTQILFILDRSGSMSSIKKSTIDSFNNFLQSQIRETPDATFRLITVSDRPHLGELRWINQITPLNNYNYVPNGQTALYDAIYDGITSTDMEQDSRILCVILTDGLENNSSTPLYAVNNVIQSAKDTGKWTFVYLGANHDAFVTSSNLGISRGNTLQYNASPQGVTEAFSNLTKSSSDYSRGLRTSVTNFFTTDVSNLSPATVRQNLKDCSLQYQSFWVGAESEIRPFVERQGFNYVRGAGFYQLTKPETIQPTKAILLREKGKRTIWGGSLARNILGLTTNDCRVIPGNHGNWDIFVQSTSVNRKLVRGTTLLYRVW